MKSKYLWWISIGLLVLFTAVSCRTAPVPEEPLVQDLQEYLGVMDEASARAQAARQLALDFGAPSLLPNEWDAANALLDQAEHQRAVGTADEIGASTARYNAAADAFEALSARTIALNFANMERELTEARSAAVDVGAEVYFPDMLLHADNTVAAANEQHNANDYYAARETALDALSMYRTLTAGIEAARIRQSIGIYLYALLPDLLAESDAAGLSAFERWESGDYRGAESSAVQALAMFSALGTAVGAQVAAAGLSEDTAELAPDALMEMYSAAEDFFTNWEAGDFLAAQASAELSLVRAFRAAAIAERQRALNVRGNVAARVEFDSAQVIFAQANTAYNAGNMGEAGRLFNDCAPLFTQVTFLSIERQLIADELLRLANERMVESDETARAAELVIEGDV